MSVCVFGLIDWHNNPHRYPTDEELLTLFTALRIQHRHEGLIRESVTKNPDQFRPGEDDIHIRKTDVSRSLSTSSVSDVSHGS
jgi:hypothetical protein